ncbi:hypothetical protein ACJIZ3_006546 [Penstemon smallii]|uniref:RING-type E3 ubiquitin transferase n=1 Tax=Penstemon smallii TaxID=265156 RepID=A0ABD3S7Z5_9LAMI
MDNQLPNDFKCPISLEIMSDPVILSSGHTFDRTSIQRWLDAGHRTCPITKLPLPEPPTLIPNHALRSLIFNYSPISFPEPNSYPTDPQTPIRILLSSSSHTKDKLNSLENLTRSSKRDSEARRRLVESGAVSAVLNCVDSGVSGLEEKALHLLLNLSLDDDSKVGLVAEGILRKVVYALRGGVGDSRAVAATLLTSLAVLEVNKVTIGSYPDLIQGLVSLLKEGNSRERKEAATALYTLCSFPDNRIRAIHSNVVPVLIRNVGSGLERAVEVLGLLAKCWHARDEMVRYSGILGILIRVVKDGSSRGVQYALLTLSYLCSHSEIMGLEGLSEGLFAICVDLLEDDNEKVRRNSKILIQVLQGKRKIV